MKLMHLSDLHLGKRVNGFSMIEDQKYILNQIIEIAEREQPSAVLIAGDVYDKPLPPEEAVRLFDSFISRLKRLDTKVIAISGNHDSAERLAFGSRIMRESGVYMAPVYDGNVEPVVLRDEFGDVNVWMLPFLKPVNVKLCFPEEADDIKTYTDALRVAVSHIWQQSGGEGQRTGDQNAGGEGQQAGDQNAGGEAAAAGGQQNNGSRNVLVTHQFVTGAARSDSEEKTVGGTDNVDADVFDGFDYVALGHIHGPQKIMRPEVRYCGTPLKYSFSEVSHEKSVTMVELGPKAEGQPAKADCHAFSNRPAKTAKAGGKTEVTEAGSQPDSVAETAASCVTITTIPLKPLRDMREIKGTFAVLTDPKFYGGAVAGKADALSDLRDCYLRVILTDEEDVPYAITKLRQIYPNIMILEYDNARTRASGEFGDGAGEEEKKPGEIFEEFFEKQNGKEMNEEQQKIIDDAIASVWEVRA